MLKEIKLAINEKIIAAYPDIEIQSKDIEEGFARPCFYVDLRTGHFSKIAPEFKTRRLSITIYYFASSRYDHSIENLEVQENLENIFLGKLVVGENQYSVPEVSSIVNDGVLQVSFDLEVNQFIEDTSTDSGELMEELELKVEEG